MSNQITWQDVNRTFGVSKHILDSYIERAGLDDRLKQALRGRNIIVIHGSSKQGKTSLWKNMLQKRIGIHLTAALSQLSPIFTPRFLRQLDLQF